MPTLLEKPRPIVEIAKMMGVSRWTALRRLRPLGVLIRFGKGKRARWYATTAAISKKLPDLFYTRAPNRDELQQLQREITALRKDLNSLRATIATMRRRGDEASFATAQVTAGTARPSDRRARPSSMLRCRL